MIFNLAATVISAALLVPTNVLGQAPTNTSQIPPCVLNCTTSALAPSGCTSITDFACICNPGPFQTAAGTCIQTNCPTDAAAALQLQNATCGPYLAGSSSSSGSGSASGSHSSTGTPAPGAGSTGSASATHASTTTTSSSAGFHTAGIASGVALALFGAAFSLF